MSRMVQMAVSAGALISFAMVAAPTLAQSVSVGDSGTPTYAHPITLPPGIAGMVPNVSLLFSGSGLNGPVGMGWSIQGISSITRCPSTIATDKVSRAVRYDSADKLCLDGQRLIQTDADGNPTGNQSADALGGAGFLREYRTEKDTFVRVRAYGAYGAAANGPAYFKVWTKSGQIYEYGNNGNTAANSVVAVPVHSPATPKDGVVATWLTSRISDVRGNYMDYFYTQRDVPWGSSFVAGQAASGHEWALAEIRYTGHGAQPPANRVVFNYIDRPARTSPPRDGAESYHLGNKNVSLWRLSSIQTQVNYLATPIDVKRYTLAYDNSASTGKSRLVSVQECAGGANSAQCLPAVKFAYGEGAGVGDVYAPDFNFAQSQASSDKLQTSDGKYGVMPLDVNGDGKTDLIRWSENTTENAIYLSDGIGGFDVGYPLSMNGDYLFKSDGCFSTLPLDVNGDGLIDLFRYASARSAKNEACKGVGQNFFLINQGEGSFERVAYTGPALTRTEAFSQQIIPAPSNPDEPTDIPDTPSVQWTGGATFYFADLNADGISDLIVTQTLGYLISDQSQGGLRQANPCDTNVCTWVYRGNGQGGFDAVPTNMAKASLYAAPKAFLSDVFSGENLIDIDGDGLIDIYGVPGWANSSRAYRSLGDFNFEPVDSEADCNYSLDFNGDGRADCLDWRPTSPRAAALSASTGNGYRKIVNFNLGISPAEPVTNDPNKSSFSLPAIYSLMDGSYGTPAAIRFIDVQPDGRTDILALYDDPAKTSLFISNGDGIYARSNTFNLNTSARQLSKTDGTYTFVLGDFLGQGSSQILRLRLKDLGGSEQNSNQLYVRGSAEPPDLLKTVTGPTGLVTRLNWESLVNSTHYTPDRPTGNRAQRPYLDVAMPMWVVTSMTVDSGVGASSVRTDFWYTGLKGSFDGRGVQGFRKVRRESPAADGKSKMSVETEYLQNYPYAGVAKNSVTRKVGFPNVVVSRTSYIYCDMTAGDPISLAPTTAQPCSSPAKIQRPYVFQSIEEAWDLSGRALPTVNTQNIYYTSGNRTGDLDTVTVTKTGTALSGALSQVSTQITKNEYGNNTVGDNWQLGRLVSSVQTNKVSDSLASVNTSAGSAANATAIKGTGSQPAPIELPKPPISNAVLATIIDLILQD